jgi:hypothetical protein
VVVTRRSSSRTPSSTSQSQDDEPGEDVDLALDDDDSEAVHEMPTPWSPTTRTTTWWD